MMIFAITLACAGAMASEYNIMLSGISGTVEVRETKDGKWIPAAEDMIVRQGGAVRTGVESGCVLRWRNGHGFRLYEGTEVELPVMNVESGYHEHTVAEIKSGAVAALLLDLISDRSDFGVVVGAAKLDVGAAGFFVHFEQDGDVTLGVESGVVDVVAGDGRESVTEGMMIKMPADGGLTRPMPASENISEVLFRQIKKLGQAPVD